jgi:hypothetical protein
MSMIHNFRSNSELKQANRPNLQREKKWVRKAIKFNIGRHEKCIIDLLGLSIETVEWMLPWRLALVSKCRTCPLLYCTIYSSFPSMQYPLMMISKGRKQPGCKRY